MLIPIEQLRALRQVLSLLRINKKRLLVATLLGACALGASIALGATSAWLIAYASFMPPVLYLQVATVSVRFFGISKAIFRYLDRLAGHRIAVEGMAHLRGGVYRRLEAAPTAQVAALKRGDLLERVQTDVDNVGDFVVKSLLPALVTALVGALTVLFFYWLNPLAALFLLLGLLLSGVVSPLLTVRSALATSRAEERARVGLSVAALTISENAADLSVNGRKDQLLDALENWEDDLGEAKDRSARPAALASALDTGSMLATVLACAWAGIFTLSHQDLNPIVLAVLTLTPLAAFEGTALLGQAAVQLVVSASSAARLVPLLNLQADAREEGETKPDLAARPHPDARGEIVLEARDLAIGWTPDAVLAEDINLTFRPGEHCALVGPSGIGKTTLLYTLAGLLRPVRGSVTLGGVEVSELTREEVASFLSVTLEDAHIFETTLLENLRVGRGELNPSEARALLEQAGLGHWLATLPAGLDTMLGSRGSTVSGGERRRILLARALASSASLLVLDEPAEHLDPHTADALLGELLDDAALGGRGSLLVTHRLSTLARADRIYVFGKEGSPVGQQSDMPARIIAAGTHVELLETCPAYAWSYRQEQADRGQA